jgi:hypothetical protein
MITPRYLHGLHDAGGEHLMWSRPPASSTERRMNGFGADSMMVLYIVGLCWLTFWATWTGR